MLRVENAAIRNGEIRCNATSRLPILEYLSRWSFSAGRRHGLFSRFAPSFAYYRMATFAISVSWIVRPNVSERARAE